MNAIEESYLALNNLKEKLKENPKIVFELLVQAKILTKSGKLTKPYKTRKENESTNQTGSGGSSIQKSVRSKIRK